MKAERQGWQVAAKARRSGNEPNSATMECSRPSGRPAQYRSSDITFIGESGFSVTDCKPKAIVSRLNWIEVKIVVLTAEMPNNKCSNLCSKPPSNIKSGFFHPSHVSRAYVCLNILDLSGPSIVGFFCIPYNYSRMQWKLTIQTRAKIPPPA
jgi:hypothetical protein